MMRPSSETHFQKVRTGCGSWSGSGERTLEVTERDLAVLFRNDGMFSKGERKEEDGDGDGDGERERRVAILGLSVRPTYRRERVAVLEDCS